MLPDVRLMVNVYPVVGDVTASMIVAGHMLMKAAVIQPLVSQ